jgi:hypothetical protein
MLILDDDTPRPPDPLDDLLSGQARRALELQLLLDLSDAEQLPLPVVITDR